MRQLLKDTLLMTMGLDLDVTMERFTFVTDFAAVMFTALTLLYGRLRAPELNYEAPVLFIC